MYVYSVSAFHVYIGLLQSVCRRVQYKIRFNVTAVKFLRGNLPVRLDVALYKKDKN